MNKILVDLQNWGCDMDGAMERFLGDEELYISCLDVVLADENFEKLGIALRNNEPAFDFAHTLKGVAANMGLTPILNTVTEIVEPLRAGKCDNLLPKYEKLLTEKDKLDDIVLKNS